jgi:peptidoglycan/LPS O-acetylase OafA/YrhL
MHQTRSNNFDALRLFAALMVIYGHGFNMSGGIGPGLWGVPFARVGLDVFFAISGYLVTGSWERTPGLWTFLMKRGLRLFPGLLLCTAFGAFVVGPLATTLPLGDYFRTWNTYKYFANVALWQRLYLPHVFEELHDPGVVNGSTWSLVPEVLCYLTVPLLALMPGLARRWALVLGGVACGALGLWLFYGYDGPTVVFYNTDLKYMLVQVPFFFVGALFRLLEPADGSIYRADFALLGFTLNWGISSWFGAWNIPVEWLTLPYMAICFGRMSMPVLRQAARFGDLSYGLYLYAFPVQQLVFHYRPVDRPHDVWAIPLCVLLSLPLAFLSWHLVEKPALLLKPRANASGRLRAVDTGVDPRIAAGIVADSTFLAGSAGSATSARTP